MPSSFTRAAVAALFMTVVMTLVAGCTVGPDYRRPALDLPTGWKSQATDTGLWKPAEPAAIDPDGQWWRIYHDPTLDGLMADASQANQNLRLAEAQYRQAQALAAQARAALLPSLGVDASAGRGRTITAQRGPQTATAVQAGLTASWEPDLWGGLHRALEASEATQAASADDVAAARLSIQSLLAQDYFQLRIADETIALYAATVDAYQRALKLTTAQQRGGVALQSDVELARTQLASAQAQAVDLKAQRAQFEHAIAVLTGRPPANFSIAAQASYAPFHEPLPVAPAGLPSALLERRPDIAAAERRVAAANAGIGVAEAAWYPTVMLSAGGGFSAAALDALFKAPARVWSLGLNVVQTLFDAGLRRARSEQAIAGWDASTAQYRATVLSGMQQVEDALSILAVLDEESRTQAIAVESAARAERLALAQYRGGTTTYLSVVTAQTLSLTNQRNAVQLRGRQLTTTVALIAALGGGWQATSPALASSASLR